MRKYIMAGNHAEFLNWCRENNENPRDKNIIYLSDIKYINGLRGITIIRYGNWHKNPCANDDYLKIAEFNL